VIENSIKSEVPRSTLKHKVNKLQGNRYRETDQYQTWSETIVVQHSGRKFCQLLFDDGEETLWANNKKCYTNGL
jgi:hypothetical protein